MVSELATMRTPLGNTLDVAITTNGHLLAKLAASLKLAGLSRVTVSMDAVSRDKFARITRGVQQLRCRRCRHSRCHPRRSANG
jgi:cyclic pyranopterin phosphate synthase